MPFHGRALSPTPTHTQDWNNVDTALHLMCTAVGCGRKPESPEETHADMERAWIVAPAGNRIFFLINVITKGCYSRTRCTWLSVAKKTGRPIVLFIPHLGKNCSLICRAAAYILFAQSVIACMPAFQVSKVSLVTLLFAHMILSLHL